MTDLNQAARAAFVSVRGERPRVPEPARHTLLRTVPTLEQQEYDSDLADFLHMLKALEQEGYKVVPIEPVGWLDPTGKFEERAFSFTPEQGWWPVYAASPEIEI